MILKFRSTEVTKGLGGREEERSCCVLKQPLVFSQILDDWVGRINVKTCFMLIARLCCAMIQIIFCVVIISISKFLYVLIQ